MAVDGGLWRRAAAVACLLAVLGLAGGRVWDIDERTVDPSLTDAEWVDSVKLEGGQGLELAAPTRGLLNLQKNTTVNQTLWAAARNGSAEIVAQALKDGAHVDYRNGAHNDTPLAVAAFYGHLKVVNVLLTSGADLEAADDNGLTVLIGASQEGHALVVAALLVAGADPNATAPSSGVSPISAAALKGHGDVVVALLAGGASPSATDADGDTPLHLAAVTLGGGAKNVTRALLDAGARVNVKGSDGDTPVFWASYFGNVGVANLLVAAGANVTMTNDAGDVPGDVICGCLGDAEIEQAIQCPEGGCEKGFVRHRLGQLLK
ncbi:unnamed protein product [Ostreobium quekettii]|uniref:Ankyrin repeat domain-containing protein n=1 Tax=Ostreobium quekettii TaxID=121088 RepID=A0A8S1JFU5_9CHLO|nr:unnamed protein product [Ostreobium quekettii]|eukprot:evm.model.scf_36.3 EVM.evm.TU.scf_36.3   scf_36:127597-132246(+)